MARYHDLLPTQGWIHELARAEVHPEADKLFQTSGRGVDPQQLVEESTIEFLAEMRDRFQEYAKIFNAYAEKNSGFQEVKIFSLAQSAADFMLFRKQMKLVVSNAAHGVIQLHFSQHLRTTMSVNGQEQYSGGKSTGPVVSSAPTASSESLASNPANELLAQIGPFRDVYWTFHGEKVSSEQVSKFYFSDFVRLTRDSGRSKGGNELLLHQIKTLLEEKGFNL